MFKSVYLAALLYIFSVSSFADFAKAVAAFNDRNYSLASELLTQLDDSSYQKERRKQKTNGRILCRLKQRKEHRKRRQRRI